MVVDQEMKINFWLSKALKSIELFKLQYLFILFVVIFNSLQDEHLLLVDFIMIPIAQAWQNLRSHER